MKTKTARALFALRLFAAPSAQLPAQDTAFSYQGRLNNPASPANKVFDFTFALFVTDSRGMAVAGSPNTPSFFAAPSIGTPETNIPVPKSIGNATLWGNPAQGSNRTHKENNRPVDPETVLAKLADIQSHTQKLKHSANELWEMVQAMDQKLGKNTKQNQ